MKEYIIPKRLLKSSMLIEGIGLKEILEISGGFIIGLILYAIVGMFNKIVALILLLLPPAIIFILVKPNKSHFNESLITQLKIRKAFASSQKRFYYVRQNAKL